MENIKNKTDVIYMNIHNFSEAIAENWNVNSDSLRDYIFANISIGLVRNEEMKKDVNKLYNQDKLKYYNATKNSDCIDHVIMTQGTLEQEIYARKLLGILLVAEEDYNLRSSVIKLLRKYYPDVFKCVRNLNKKELQLRYSQMDPITMEKEARIDAAVYFYFAIYRSAEIVDQGFIVSIINDMKNFQHSSPMTTNIDYELERHKDEIQEIKSLIKKDCGKINGYKDILDNEKEYIGDMGVILENLYIINKLDIGHIFHKSEFLNIDKIILAYVKLGKKQLEPKTIIQSLISGVFIQSVINEYKNSRKLYFKDNQESLFFHLSSLKEKVRDIENENKEMKLELSLLKEEKLLSDEILNTAIGRVNKNHRSEISELQSKIDDLEKQLIDEKKYRRELNTLREYIFQVNNQYIPKAEEENLSQYIQNKKLLIIGGTKEWRRKFREKYPEIRTLNGFNDAFEISILSSFDYIFFYTGYMNHSTYNKAMNVIRMRQFKFGYIGKTNIDLVEQEIIEELKRCGVK